MPPGLCPAQGGGRNPPSPRARGAPVPAFPRPSISAALSFSKITSLCAPLCGSPPARGSRKQAENSEVTLAVPCQPRGDSGKPGTALSQQLPEPPAGRGRRDVPYRGVTPAPQLPGRGTARAKPSPARGRSSDPAQGSRALSLSLLLLLPCSPIPAPVPGAGQDGRPGAGAQLSRHSPRGISEPRWGKQQAFPELKCHKIGSDWSRGRRGVPVWGSR